MNSPDDQPYRSDKVVKRGTVGKDPTSPNKTGSSPPDLHRLVLPVSLPPGSAYESKVGAISHTNHRVSRGMENWMPKGYVLAIICLLSIFALSGSFMFANSFRQVTEIGIGVASDDGSGLSIFPSKLPFADRWRLYGRSRELDVRQTAWTSQMKSLADRGVTCDPRFATVKVFLYDLPSEFHFGMMPDFEPSPIPHDVWPRNLSDLPRYPGGLYQQHSPEYWLTADILTSVEPGRTHECTAVRVKNYKEADVFLVPFFASLSYNKYTKLEHDGEDLNEELQEKLVKYLKQQTPWQESGGKDHVVVIHHPNSMHKVRDQLSSAIFVVCDFGRYPSEVANIGKDIVAPYKHVIPSYKDDSSTFDSRTMLLFFQGAIVRKEGGIIRQKLNELLKEEEGVHFVTGNTRSNGIKSATVGMRISKFCLHLAGDTPSSNRLFDAIASHCVPVVISDDIELPYEDALDYSEFCLFIRSIDALKKGFVIKLLRGIEKEEWTRMWLRLKEVAVHFEYQHPTEPNDAVNMMWMAIARKAPSVRYSINKGKRYARSGWLQTLPGEAPRSAPSVIE